MEEDVRLYRWMDAALQPASILAMVLLPIVWCLIFYQVAEVTKRSEEEAQRAVTDLARVTENYVYRTVRRLDDRLLSVQADFAGRTGNVALAEWLPEVVDRREIPQIAVLDEKGIIRATGRGPTPPVDLSEREHFKFLSTTNSEDLYISRPIEARVIGATAMRLARRLTRQDQSFGGIVVASLEPGFLGELARSLEHPAEPTLALVGLDGGVRATHGPDHNIRSVHDADSVNLKLDQIVKEPQPGIQWAEPRGDRAGRVLIAYRKVESYPLIAVAALSERDVFRGNIRSKLMYAAIGGVVTVGLLVATFVATSREMRLQATAKSLAQTNNRFQTSLANMPHGVCMFDRTQRLVISNARYAEMYNLPSEAIRPGTTLTEILQARVEAGTSPADADAYMAGRLADVARKEPCQIQVQLRDGRTIAIDHQPMGDGGFVGVHQDITHQKASEARISYLAHHDPLTGLLNRAAFLEKVDEGLARQGRGDERFNLLLLDLDRFKQVNDGHGHPVGDVLLQQVAARLRAEIRQTDILARLGGDEFAIVQSFGSDDPVLAGESLSSRLIKTLARPFAIDHAELLIGTSIGIAIADNPANSPGRLMKMADLALYHAKAKGRGTFVFFDRSFEEQANIRNSLESDLRRAVATQNLALHYQPIIDTQTGALWGAEALLRWEHETRGWISPAQFVPLAEESGLIGEIGQWALRRACADACQWPSTAKVAVNISALQLRDPVIIDLVATVLEETRLAPQRLELEITETALLDHAAEAREVLRQLKELGVSVALDDFGTGYSSLSHVTMFPFDKIKIDRSFIANMASRTDCQAVIAGVLALANTLNMKTTAEGVETIEQLRLLRQAGVSSMQGYFIQRPVPAAALDFTLTVNDRLKNAVA